jgi:hypothetical protein
VPLLLGTLLGLAFGYAIIPSIVVGSLLASHTLLGLSIVRRLGALRLEPVIDAVVNHLYEMASAEAVPLFLGLSGVRGMSPEPGASAAKIGSSRCTTSFSPPIIMQ